VIQDHWDHTTSKGNDESLTRVDSSVLLTRHDMSDLESLILIRVILEGRSEVK